MLAFADDILILPSAGFPAGAAMGSTYTAPFYDADGNLVLDGDSSDPGVVWYAWDADGHLRQTMSEYFDCDVRYDRHGRRVRLVVARGSPSGSWAVHEVRAFDYEEVLANNPFVGPEEDYVKNEYIHPYD